MCGVVWCIAMPPIESAPLHLRQRQFVNTFGNYLGYDKACFRVLVFSSVSFRFFFFLLVGPRTIDCLSVGLFTCTRFSSGHVWMHIAFGRGHAIPHEVVGPNSMAFIPRCSSCFILLFFLDGTAPVGCTNNEQQTVGIQPVWLFTEQDRRFGCFVYVLLWGCLFCYFEVVN